LLNLGQLQLKAGQIDSAEANVRESLIMYEQMFPDSDSIEIARSRHFLALVLKDKRSYEDAVQMLRSSRSVYRTLSKWIHVAISCREQRFVEFFLFFVQLLPYFPFSTAFFYNSPQQLAASNFCGATLKRLSVSMCER